LTEEQMPPREVGRLLLAQLGALTGGLALDDYLRAWWEWYSRLARRPERRAELVSSALQKWLELWKFSAQAAAGLPLSPGGEELGFAGSAWALWPFNVYARAYRDWVAWLAEALNAAADATAAGQADNSRAAGTERLRFATHVIADAFSPANYLVTNPELIERTVAESGQNLLRGLNNWLEDAERMTRGARPRGSERYEIGKNVAVTPGKVIFRNRLIELIQYTPQTQQVYAEPVLITPAWIMKYYILDLSPRNSLVRYLIEKGHTVFMLSWRNPTGADRDLGLDDYLELGFLAALDVVSKTVAGRKVHAVGYCIGGTLLAIGAALLAAAGDTRIATVTLLASLTDFSAPGELSVFISPSQLAVLEALMYERGVLESERMAAAFAMLRSRDLIWKPAVDAYVRGETPSLNDLMAWNADGTRMPWRMHSEYLYRLYLRNELARGEFTACGRPIDLRNIEVPMFVVGTETDHVAPWRSVYKVRELTRSPDFTFLLTSGGHNAGIVSGPSHPRRKYRALTWRGSAQAPPANVWRSTAPEHAGSWWPAWRDWLAHNSSGELEPGRQIVAVSPSTGAQLEDAPGRYVHG
jgi:polyhydroxyalkanoate synthase subunit PhaC